MLHTGFLFDASYAVRRVRPADLRLLEDRTIRRNTLTLLAAGVFALLSCTNSSETVRFDSEPTVSSGPEAGGNSTPPFFRVDGGAGATLQLLGTIHLGPEEGWSFPSDVNEAVESANSVLVEVDLREMTEESASQALMRHGILPADTPLSKIISSETAELLEIHEDALTTSGAPANLREAMQPWFIMVLMVETTIQESGMSTKYSVEEALMETLRGRELLSLETLDQQLAFFGDMPIPLQELMLQETLNQWDEAQAQLFEMIEAWRSNDLKTLLRIAYEGIDENPDLRAFYDVLIDGRNRSWVPRLVDLLEDPKRAGTTVLVAVGALHLVGPEGVPSLLSDAGYRVEAPPRPKLEAPGES